MQAPRLINVKFDRHGLYARSTMTEAKRLELLASNFDALDQHLIDFPRGRWLAEDIHGHSYVCSTVVPAHQRQGNLRTKTMHFYCRLHDSHSGDRQRCNIHFAVSAEEYTLSAVDEWRRQSVDAPRRPFSGITQHEPYREGHEHDPVS